MSRSRSLGNTEPFQPLREDRWEAFAVHVNEGKSIPDSYIAAGFTCSRGSAKFGGARLLSKTVVKARIAYLANNCHLSRDELLALLARCARSATSSLKDRIAAGQECSRMMGWNRGPKAEPAKVAGNVVMHSEEWDKLIAAATQGAVAKLEGVGPEPMALKVEAMPEPVAMDDW